MKRKADSLPPWAKARFTLAPGQASPVTLDRRLTPSTPASPGSVARQPIELPPEILCLVLGFLRFSSPARCLRLLSVCKGWLPLLDPLMRPFWHEVTDPVHLAPCLGLNKLGDKAHRRRVELFHLFNKDIETLRRVGDVVHQKTVPQMDLVDIVDSIFPQQSVRKVRPVPHTAVDWSELLWPFHMAHLRSKLLWEHTPLGLFQREQMRSGDLPPPTTMLSWLFELRDGRPRPLLDDPTLMTVDLPGGSALMTEARYAASGLPDPVQSTLYSMALQQGSESKRMGLAYELLRDRYPVRKAQPNHLLRDCIVRVQGESSSPDAKYIHINLASRRLYRHDGPLSCEEKCRALAFKSYLAGATIASNLLKRFNALFKPVFSIDLTDSV